MKTVVECIGWLNIIEKLTLSSEHNNEEAIKSMKHYLVKFVEYENVRITIDGIKTCEWSLEDDGCGFYYQTGCDKNGTEMDGDLYNYCPYCGGRIEINEHDE